MEKLIQNFNEFVFDEDLYKNYLIKWLDGIMSELIFWKNIIEKNGNERSQEIIDKIFSFEEYITSDRTKFLDVGSGPFSTCGIKTAKTELEFYAVDPLAFIYKAIKEKNSINIGISPDFAFVEKLHEKFVKNVFDIVHMQNSLDHAFDPILGILSMLYVCKIGGKIILKHARNEAENEKYSGFHQWNLCTEKDEFIAWRPGVKYNISKMLLNYVVIDVIDISTERLFTVIFTKKDNIEYTDIQIKLLKITNEQIFNKLSKLIINDAYSLKNISLQTIKKIIKKIPFVRHFARIIYDKYRKHKNVA